MISTSAYLHLPAHFYAPAPPATFPDPRLLAWNTSLAKDLGLTHWADDEQQLARWLSGNEPLSDTAPVALVYAGQQFGQFVPQLGDGRAVLLGDVQDRSGQRFDLQLKGAGRTPYSRGGDGKSSLGPVIREYVLSEAMHALGVPTTRALAAVTTGEQVHRQLAVPGGVLTRIASSHIRIGTFQFFAARQDTEALEQLLNYAIERHFPDIAGVEKAPLMFFAKVLERQAELVAHWMALGFIHGVMNTDNTAISGETLDYGPCAFMDEYRANKVFSSIDHAGRYAYNNQAPIIHWNLARLAECLLLLDEDVPAFQEQLSQLPERYEAAYERRMLRKLGLENTAAQDRALIPLWLTHLELNELDYTLSFRQLADRALASDAPQFGEFEQAWRARLALQSTPAETIREHMNAVNPCFIPRNHQVERAIQAAFAGDYTIFNELNSVLQKPFVEQAEFDAYAQPPLEQERVAVTFCGT